MAGLFFRKHRTLVVSPFVADADPNVTPPAAADIFETGDKNSTGDYTQGHVLYCAGTAAGVDVPEVKVDFITWIQNENDGTWASITPEVGAVNRRLYGVDLYGDTFVQVTAVDDTTATADTLEIWITEAGEL